VISDATSDDPDYFMERGVRDVVADGTQPCSRRLSSDERDFATKRLAGRPTARKKRPSTTAKKIKFATQISPGASM
jgi:hypothetical protein